MNIQISKLETKISNLDKTVKNRNRKFCKMKNLRKPKPYSTSLKKPKPENFETEPALLNKVVLHLYSQL